MVILIRVLKFIEVQLFQNDMKSQESSPLLSIAIPTYKRSDYLRDNLKQLALVGKNHWNEVELIVSDNCSPDATESVVREAQRNGLPVTYIRNEENIGSDANIAQCFNVSKGKYVLILGDDDFFMDGALTTLIDLLKSNEVGVACFK
jgi:abequosyltransferase